MSWYSIVACVVISPASAPSPVPRMIATSGVAANHDRMTFTAFAIALDIGSAAGMRGGIATCAMLSERIG
jgi:hypothetical protein